ncbi:MAG: hypothetical protein ABIF89_02425 [bacterium]
MLHIHLNSEEIEKIKKLEGKARGQTIKNALQSTELIEGKEGLEKLKVRLKELNCWMDIYQDYKIIKIFDWYPMWYDIMPIVVAADLFAWDEEKLKTFGAYNQRVSFFEKVLLKYFISLELVLKFTPERWRKNYSVGDLAFLDFNEDEGRATLVLKNFIGHPTFCCLLLGFFVSANKFVVHFKEMTGEETKCVFHGDPYHEYLIKWTK